MRTLPIHLTTEVTSILGKFINAIKEEKFAKKIEEIKAYESENDKYKLIAPTSISDIINEGKALSHCVASYIDYVIEGKSVIMFLRSKENLDKPFITVEFKEGKVTQVKGFSDTTIKDKEILTFLLKTEKKMQKNMFQISA